MPQRQNMTLPRTVKIDGRDFFYREAGPKNKKQIGNTAISNIRLSHHLGRKL